MHPFVWYADTISLYIHYSLISKELIGHLMKLSLSLQTSEISLADAFTRVAATKHYLLIWLPGILFNSYVMIDKQLF